MPTCTYMYVHVILADIQCLYPYPADPLYLILGEPDILSLFYVSIESLCLTLGEPLCLSLGEPLFIFR